MTREKRISLNNKLMEKFTKLDSAGLDVICSTTEYGTWSTFTVFAIGNSDKALTFEMSDKSDVIVKFCGISNSYVTFNSNTIETYLTVFIAVATIDNVTRI